MNGSTHTGRNDSAEPNYWRKVKSLFARRPESNGVTRREQASGSERPQNTEAAGRVAQAEILTAGREQFEAHLKELIGSKRSNGGLLAGRVQLIELDRIRERMGERWPRVSQVIHGQIKAELKSRLAAQDLFTQVDDGTYVIVFADSSGVEARLKTAMLTEQILARLFGEDSGNQFDALRIESVVAEIDDTLALQSGKGLVSLDGLLKAARAAAPTPSSRAYSASPNTGQRALTPETVAEFVRDLDTYLDRVEHQSRSERAGSHPLKRMQDILQQLESLEAALAEDEPQIPSWEKEGGTVGAPGRDDEYFRLVKLVRQLKARADRQLTLMCSESERQVLRDAGEESDDQDEIKLDLSYLPLWHVGTQRLGIYLCRSRLLAPNLADFEHRPEFREMEADIAAAMDRLTFRKARQDLRKSESARRPNIVGIPLHLSSLRRQGSRSQILEMCNNVPNSLRKFIVWEIIGAPTASWSRQLPEAIAPLRRFGRAVFVRIDNLERNFRDIQRHLHHLKAAGVHEVGVDVAELDLAESDCLALMERFLVVTEREGLRCYGLGFDSVSLTVCAVCMGFEHAAGKAVSPPTKEPKGVQVVAIDSIYGRITSIAARGNTLSLVE